MSDAGFLVDAGEQIIDSNVADAGSVTSEAVVVPRVVIRIEGAKALPPDVYLDALRLPQDARPNKDTAAEVRKQLRAYLVRTGFELATVSATASRDGINVDLDEGQIERVIFIGQLSFKLMSFKLGLFLPNDVFNRSLLDTQVRELAQKLDLPGVRWELVRTAEVPHVGPQIDELPDKVSISVQNEPVIHARRPYEVRVFIPPDVPGNRLGVELRSGYMDGLEAGLGYSRINLFGEGDRAFVGGSGGVGLRSRIDTEKLYAHFSRAFFGLGYQTVPMLRGFKLILSGEGTWLARQRADLALEDYNAVTAETGGLLEYMFREGTRIQAGAGFQWRRLFGFQLAPDRALSPDADINDRKRPFVRIGHESVFYPLPGRWDRRHTFESDFRQYFPLPTQPGLGWVDLRYQYVRSLGWHDVWVKSRGHVSWGDVTFHDELSLGEFAHGLFGTQFVPSAINLQLEFRFSVTRDLLKFGIFHDLVVFDEPLRTVRARSTQLANAFGPGVHLLAQDLFQLDMYMAFGFRRNSQFGAAFSMQLQKAF
ncbi:MAG: hypothetical protein ACT4TC_09030 [Myxococcaceae bacterium]